MCFPCFSLASNAKLLFEHNTDINGAKATLYLSNIGAALPSSEILRDKDIKAVISILQPHELDSAYSAMTQLYAPTSTDEILYQDGLDTVVRSKENGILYYNLNIADVSNPQILSKPKPPSPPLTASDVFSRFVSFMQVWLSQGVNVLVHCEQGRRRSPTAILAFLVHQGLRTHQAVKLIGSSYAGDESWADGYTKSRQMWIASLSKFETEHSTLLAGFRLAHPKLYRAFQGFKWTEEDKKRLEEEIRLEQAKLKKKEEESKKRSATTDLAKVEPPVKKYKIAAKPMVPSAWANRKK